MLDEVNCPVVLDGPVLIRDHAEAECDAINVRDATYRIYPFWWNSVLHERTRKDSTHWLDGLVGCATDDGRFLVTSPTTSYIPRPLYGKIDIRLEPDGHFGSADPIHHPQFIQHESHYPWMAAIRRKRAARSLLRNLWYPLDETAEFELLRTTSVALGVVTTDFKRYANDAVLPLGKLVALFEQAYGTNPELSWLFNTLLDAVDRLAFPATFRDMARTWACVQRFSLYTCAWFDWNITFMQTYKAPSLISAFEPIPYEEWMGCFTSSTLLASRLAKANAPVWVMRPIENFSGDEVIEEAVVFSEPVACLACSSTVDSTASHHPIANPFVSTRYAGDDHLTWINRMAVRYLDQANISSGTSSSEVEQPPATALPQVKANSPPTIEPTLNTVEIRYSPYRIPQSSTSHGVKIGRNERLKFETFIHPLLPPPIPVWQTACSSVDVTTPAPTGLSVWRYMFPEARLVSTSPTPRRQLRFICNWLRLRETWLFLVSSTTYTSETVHPLRNQEWREYLYTSSATQTTDDSKTSNIALQRHERRNKKSVAHKRAVHDLFRKVFGRNVMDCPVPSEWFGRSLDAFQTDQTDLSDTYVVRTVQLVGWELHELEFRWELMQLEKTVVPIADDELVDQHERQQLVDNIFPTRCKLRLTGLPVDNAGLSAENAADRAPYVEALRILLCRWPSSPSSIAECSPLTTMATSEMEQVEATLVLFYCQTFWSHAGRAPVLPRRMQ